ncbi:MAG TPA: glycosyltransferase [Pyrinomonadaceae bacterium]|nr:glycosyltransferase [Pyrinomonadaceae bacterium]
MTQNGTILIEGTDDVADLRRRVEETSASEEVLLVCMVQHREVVESVAKSFNQPPKVVSLASVDDHVARVLQAVNTERVAFLPERASFVKPAWDELPAGVPSLMSWLPEAQLPDVQAIEEPSDARAWLASKIFLHGLTRPLKISEWNFFNLAIAAQEAGQSIRWPSPRASSSRAEAFVNPPTLNRNSSVLALIPHYRCEQWLGACLESLLAQTRPLDGIVVIDDASPHPPVEIVRRFPTVTLLAAAENGGPYRLIQEVINNTRYDAYLFQDADDWSTFDRLELLLDEAERTGAELIGSQELRVLCDSAEILPCRYPLDVNAALAVRPAHPLLHPTSLIARDLVRRLGGFATGLRFGGDSELLLRAGHVARIVNVPSYCYFRRHRSGSLTTDPTTGLETPVRLELQKLLIERQLNNASAVLRGESPVLEPFASAPPAQLTHILGPELRS